MKSVLITGAAGFIGSNLTRSLLDRGYRVAGIDNLSHGSLLNLDASRKHPMFTFREGDVGDQPTLGRAAEGCDAIVHLASLKIPRYSDAHDTLTGNVRASQSVTEVARRTGARVVCSSTSEVYGKNPQVPFSESSDSVLGSPNVKRWAYAISKMFEEQLLFACRDRYGMPVVVLRLFGAYGPNQNLTWWGGPQAVFINAALDGEALEIHGDGSQTRTFTYVSDHVDGITRAIETDAAAGRVFNLGNTQEISILDLARLVWRLIRPDEAPKLRFVPYETFGRYEDVMRRVPDITQARSILGFEPAVGLEEGLRKTIAWQVERRTHVGIEGTRRT